MQKLILQFRDLHARRSCSHITTNPANPVIHLADRAAQDQKLSEAVITKLLASFEQHGTEVIEEVRKKRPEAYLAACVSLLPKQQEKLDSPFADLTDDELELLEQFLKSTRAKQITTIDATAQPSATSDDQERNE